MNNPTLDISPEIKASQKLLSLGKFLRYKEREMVHEGRIRPVVDQVKRRFFLIFSFKMLVLLISIPLLILFWESFNFVQFIIFGVVFILFSHKVYRNYSAIREADKLIQFGEKKDR